MTEVNTEIIEANVKAALLEDVGSGDVSASLIDEDTKAEARVITREAGIWCGSPWVTATLSAVDPAARLHWEVEDGDVLLPDQALFHVTGAARSLLTAERTMLNFAQLLSGTATATNALAKLISHTGCRLLDTRKTIPGLRVAQKYAVRCGGGQNHRTGLFDAFLLKENHIAAAGSIAGAVSTARQLHPELPLEVEVETLGQLEEAIKAGADIVMLDNFDISATREAVAIAKNAAKLEASGNVDATTIVEIAETGVDYISVGAITKEVRPLDLSMRFV